MSVLHVHLYLILQYDVTRYLDMTIKIHAHLGGYTVTREGKTRGNINFMRVK